MGFTDSCSGDDEVYMLMIVIMLRRNFSFFISLIF